MMFESLYLNSFFILLFLIKKTPTENKYENIYLDIHHSKKYIPFSLKIFDDTLSLFYTF